MNDVVQQNLGDSFFLLNEISEHFQILIATFNEVNVMDDGLVNYMKLEHIFFGVLFCS